MSAGPMGQCCEKRGSAGKKGKAVVLPGEADTCVIECFCLLCCVWSLTPSLNKV